MHQQRYISRLETIPKSAVFTQFRPSRAPVDGWHKPNLTCVALLTASKCPVCKSNVQNVLTGTTGMHKVLE